MSEAREESSGMAVDPSVEADRDGASRSAFRKSKWRWLALLLLAIPLLAPAPWKAWNGETRNAEQTDPPKDVESTQTRVPEGGDTKLTHAPQGAEIGNSGANLGAAPLENAAVHPGNGGEGAFSMTALGYGSVFPGSAEGAGALIRSAEKPGSGVHNSRSDSAGRNNGGGRGALPIEASTGFPPLSSLAAGSSRLSSRSAPSASPAANDSPASGPNASPKSSQDPAEPVDGSNAIIPSIAEAAPLASPERQIADELLPLSSGIPGDPFAGKPAALDPAAGAAGEPTTIAAAAPLPGTGMLLLLGFSLLLLVPRFRRSAHRS